MEAGGIYWYLWGSWSGLEAREACLVEHTPGHVAWGGVKKGASLGASCGKGNKTDQSSLS